MKDKIRVFVSYSSDDRGLADKLVKTLKRLGLLVLWSESIRPGMAFTEEIKHLIKKAHVFIPLLTKSSKKRPWVHQETGYAMALNIPVLPIAVGSLPNQMIAPIEAVKVKAKATRADFMENLKRVKFRKIASPPGTLPTDIIQVAEWPEQRTELLALSAKGVRQFGEYGMLRQRGSLSSFSLPRKHPSDKIWDAKEGTRRRSFYYRSLQREERKALEEHALKRGCRIVFRPKIQKERREPETMATRLRLIIEFIKSIRHLKRRDGRRFEFVWAPRTPGGNLTIVGDWFSAESRVPRDGYQQTLFDWHAPNVLRAVRRFDAEFDAYPARRKYSSDPKTGEKTLDDLLVKLRKRRKAWKKKHPRKRNPKSRR